MGCAKPLFDILQCKGKFGYPNGPSNRRPHNILVSAAAFPKSAPDNRFERAVGGGWPSGCWLPLPFLASGERSRRSSSAERGLGYVSHTFNGAGTMGSTVYILYRI